MLCIFMLYSPLEANKIYLCLCRCSNASFKFARYDKTRMNHSAPNLTTGYGVNFLSVTHVSIRAADVGSPGSVDVQPNIANQWGWRTYFQILVENAS